MRRTIPKILQKEFLHPKTSNIDKCNRRNGSPSLSILQLAAQSRGSVTLPSWDTVSYIDSPVNLNQTPAARYIESTMGSVISSSLTLTLINVCAPQTYNTLIFSPLVNPIRSCLLSLSNAINADQLLFLAILTLPKRCVIVIPHKCCLSRFQLPQLWGRMLWPCNSTTKYSNSHKRWSAAFSIRQVIFFAPLIDRELLVYAVTSCLNPSIALFSCEHFLHD